MTRDNLCDKVNAGDIIFYGDERVQVYQLSKSAKPERLSVIDDGHGLFYTSTASLSSWREIPQRAGDTFALHDTGEPATYYGDVVVSYRRIKTIPVLFGGGELSINKYRHYTLAHVLEGAPKAVAGLKLCRFDLDPRIIDMEFAAVVPAQISLPRLAGAKGFTKLDLMAYVIHVNGEGKLSRDPIMKKVAELEGKPWVRTSNTSYFSGVESGGSAQASGTLRKAATGPRGAILYGLGQEGRARATKVLARLGPEPGRI
jgi:hypothetical protein